MTKQAAPKTKSPTRHDSKSRLRTTTRRGSATRDRYPYLLGCYVDDGFERTLAREFMQGTVNVSHYKGGMLLRVLPECPKTGEKHHCACPLIQYPSAWLRGDDLDALIKILREAKRVWLRAYRKAARAVTKHRAHSLITSRRPTK